MAVKFVTIRHPHPDHQDTTAAVVASTLPVWLAKGWSLVEEETPEQQAAAAQAAEAAEQDAARLAAEQQKAAESGAAAANPGPGLHKPASSADGNLAGS